MLLWTRRNCVYADFGVYNVYTVDKGFEEVSFFNLCVFVLMAGKQDVKGLVDRLLELIEKLVGSTCFTREELDDVVRKLQEAVDELQKVVS